jgi:predicted ATP-grasp superfamily ATP-dependent carboligase
MKLHQMALTLFLLIGLLSCGDKIRETAAGKTGSDIRLLIASDSTDFKKSLVSKLIDQAGVVYEIRWIDVSQLKQVNEADYAQIVVLTSLKMGLPDKNTISLLNRTADKAKISLVLTSGGSRWSAPAGVDTITSASKPEESEDLILKIMDKLKINFPE